METRSGMESSLAVHELTSCRSTSPGGWRRSTLGSAWRHRARPVVTARRAGLLPRVAAPGRVRRAGQATSAAVRRPGRCRRSGMVSSDTNFWLSACCPPAFFLVRTTHGASCFGSSPKRAQCEAVNPRIGASVLHRIRCCFVPVLVAHVCERGRHAGGEACHEPAQPAGSVPNAAHSGRCQRCARTVGSG